MSRQERRKKKLSAFFKIPILLGLFLAGITVLVYFIDWPIGIILTIFLVIYFVAVLLVIFRELAITSLRLVLVNASGKVVAANMLGKIKTVSQIVCICALFIEPLVDALICHIDPTFFFAHVFPLSYLTVGVMLVFTLWSGINYIKGGWKFIATDW
jgi:phosphatidylglycerophosphate synthase